MFPRIRRLWFRLVHALRPERPEPDLAREVASHLALLEDDLVRRGMTREAAYTEARKQLGGAESAKHLHRDTRSFRWLDELLIDVKYAVRRLRSRPGTTALAIGMLAVAVGLSTAMFTIVDALIVRPLPFPHAERLASLYMASETGSGNTVVSTRILDTWRASPAFERVEGASPFTGVIESAVGPVASESAMVTPGLLDMLGVRPLHGRLFDAERPDDHEVLLSATLWHSAFQGDEAILGQEIRLDGQRRVVAGILPPSFRFPRWNTDVWRVGPMSAGQEYRPYVRIAAGVPEEDALRVATQAASTTGEFPTTWRATREPIVGGSSDTYYQRAVWFLAGAVVLVTLVLCVNVSSLLLTRLSARRREFAVCAALGASRARVLRQAVVESLMLGVFGVFGGVLLAWTLVTVAAAILPQAFLTNSLNPLALDNRALIVAAVTGLSATVAACMIPAWIATRVHRDGGGVVEKGGTDTRRGRFVARALLVSEVAMACALLVGATLLVRSFVNVTRIDRGFDPSGMMTVAIWVEGTTEATRVVTSAIEDEMRALRGVIAAVWSGSAPLNAGMIRLGRWTSDVPDSEPVEINIEIFTVGPGYFDFYGIPLLKGRGFAPGDGEDVVIVGERFAAALWPGMEPVGRSFVMRSPDRMVRVVGVAKETRRSVIDERLDRADVYQPFDGRRSGGLYLALRCETACPSEGVLRQVVGAHPATEVMRVTRLDDAFARDLEQPRASAVLVLTFAVVGLIASAGGLFSVLTHAVQERRREFGIRSALGATPRAIATVVYREGLIVGGAGLLLGAAVAATFASTLEAISYDASASDPVGVTIVAATLVVTIALALWRPARTAARTDPALLLKEE